MHNVPLDKAIAKHVEEVNVHVSNKASEELTKKVIHEIVFKFTGQDLVGILQCP